MAKILSIEVEASQVRVAEIEVRGKKGRILTVSAFRHLRERWKMDRSGIPKVLQKF